MSILSWRNCVREVSLTPEEVKNSRCTCQETGNPDEFGDGSSLPCMSHEPDVDLHCKDCIYCQQKN